MHKTKEEVESEIPTVSIDYMFLGDENEDPENGKEWWTRKETGMPVLVMHDDKSKAIQANMMPEKG